MKLRIASGAAVLILLVAGGVYAGEKILLDEAVEVIRADFKEFHFRVPEDVRGNVVFSGSFSTSGGFNDDITFLAFDQENYVRWFNQYKHKTIEKQEKQHKGGFRFTGEPGQTYYFVLDNFFSSVTNKKVKLQIRLALP